MQDTGCCISILLIETEKKNLLFSGEEAHERPQGATATHCSLSSLLRLLFFSSSLIVFGFLDVFRAIFCAYHLPPLLPQLFSFLIPRFSFFFIAQFPSAMKSEASCQFFFLSLIQLKNDGGVSILYISISDTAPAQSQHK